MLLHRAFRRRADDRDRQHRVGGRLTTRVENGTHLLYVADSQTCSRSAALRSLTVNSGCALMSTTEGSGFSLNRVTLSG